MNSGWICACPRLVVWAVLERNRSETERSLRPLDKNPLRAPTIFSTLRSPLTPRSAPLTCSGKNTLLLSCKKWKATLNIQWKWHTAKYSDPYSGWVNCRAQIQSAHIQQWTHTHPEQWAANAAAPGEQLGVRSLAQGHLSRGIEGGVSTVHSLPQPKILAGHETRTRNLWITSLTL